MSVTKTNSTLAQDRSFLITLESAIRTHPAYKLPFGDKMGQREKEWIAAGTRAEGRVAHFGQVTQPGMHHQ